MRWFLERKGAGAQDKSVRYHVWLYRPSVSTQYFGKIMNLLVAPDTLKSHELGNREKIGANKDVHDGPVAFTALLRILGEINCQ